jgi:hypothetical protein
VVTCRGTWARVTIDQFRHWALQTFKKHGVSSNILSNNDRPGPGRARGRSRSRTPPAAAAARGG